MVCLFVCFLDMYCKTYKERNKLREELLHKKEAGLDDLRTSELTQMAEDAKIKRFTVRKRCSREKSKGVAVQPCVHLSGRSKFQVIPSSKRLFEEVKCVTHRALLTPSHRKPKLEINSEIFIDNPPV